MSFRALFPPTSKARSPGAPWCAYNSAALSGASAMSGTSVSAGARLRAAVEAERPLQVVGTVNAYAALLAERAGFRALYLSGAGVANASFGLPDLGITSRNDVCEDVRRICAATALPLLVDADTGFGAAAADARRGADPRRRGAPGRPPERRGCAH